MVKIRVVRALNRRPAVWSAVLGVLLFAIAGLLAAPAAQISAVTEYTGAADASGAVACGTDFFLMCEDEESVLRVYPRNGRGASVAEIDLGDLEELRIPREKKELDLEAAAVLGDKVFWIGSHGNNKEGKIAPNRRQLFATTVTAKGAEVRVELTGQPYRRLVEDILAAPALREFRLAESAAKGRAPKDEAGFNIEGLAATPDGHLLVGLRNPVPEGRALLVPLQNPEEMIRGTNARLGAPIRLDLGGRGIRDIVLAGREYFILAGDTGGPDGPKMTTQLFRWAGVGHAPVKVTEFPNLNPEALIMYPDRGDSELQVLSDDGQKPSPPAAKRTFRSVKVRL